MSENRETGAATGAILALMDLDDDACYRALSMRDARLDGKIFVGVRTTGIYCRPICPARTPLRRNVTFYASAAAAQEAGFRPCLRCRPETSPDLGAWRGSSNTVARALAMIEDGALDAGDVEGLADRLGVGGRQLRRLFKQHLGASPVAVAQTRRVLLAKQLICDTTLPMAEVALAAGFGSVRRFNETFQQLYARAPAELRRRQRPEVSAEDGGGVVLRLAYRAPYDWAGMLDFLALRAVPGVEAVSGGRYRRTLSVDGTAGLVTVGPGPGETLEVCAQFPRLQVLPQVIARVRRVFDLGADPAQVNAHLSLDPHLAPLVAQRPGLRAPGAWDGFELAVRAVLGQQITVAGARALAGRLAAEHGEVLPAALAGEGLSLLFPTPQALARIDPETLPMPRARGRALVGLAAAAAADPDLFAPRGSLEGAVARLKALPGIGEWTAQYIALRQMREPDAFPHGDIGLMRAMAGPDGQRPSAAELLARAEAWRPWRAYGALHLWASEGLAPTAETPTLLEVSHDQDAA
ncbi:AlkA N-terminal domain-containing protein [Phenylobacterium sp.]|jgi:AraC family transcriptional regulator of adaptative response / DNA-3-methyladenine glycosylase II|uniref:AlkA N-terminal domain-containing protein n=1 Tax=Phenylobacterium sp. TaxID=1871053 RepID=UPI0025D86E26|nr:AlkA N-terminal domain-containing protein [Phenylobacterium sp.]|tara:strand:+ start:9355 stop:10923 length:1569 start_codon:yes stop_codon:yes gene_type:complete